MRRTVSGRAELACLVGLGRRFLSVLGPGPLLLEKQKRKQENIKQLREENKNVTQRTRKKLKQRKGNARNNFSSGGGLRGAALEKQPKIK